MRILGLPGVCVALAACGGTTIIEQYGATDTGGVGGGASGIGGHTAGAGASVGPTGGNTGSTGGVGGITAGTGGSGGITAGTGGSGGIAAGTGGSGGTTAGTGGAPAGAAGTGGIAPVGHVGTLGAACSPPASLACAGNFQKVALVCSASGAWEVNQTCPGTQVCDTRAGLTAGSCQEQAAECLGHEPGYTACMRSAMRTCNADNTEAEVVLECAFCRDDVCYHGCVSADVGVDCTGECAPVDPTSCSTAAARGCVGTLTMALPEAPSFVMGRAPGSAAECACSSGRAGYAVRLSNPAGAQGIKVTATSPWRIFMGGWDPCYETSAGSACVVMPVSGGDATFTVYTDESTAPPAVFLAEAVTADATCP
jgi:hypothetical protein